MRKLSLLAVLALVSGAAYAQTPTVRSIYAYMQGNGLGEFRSDGSTFGDASTTEWALGFLTTINQDPRVVMGLEFFFETYMPTHATYGSISNPAFSGAVTPVKDIKGKIFFNTPWINLYINSKFVIGLNYTWVKPLNTTMKIAVFADLELALAAGNAGILDNLDFGYVFSYNLPKGFIFSNASSIRISGYKVSLRFDLIGFAWSYQSFALGTWLRLEPIFFYAGGFGFDIGGYGYFRYDFNF